MKHLKKYNESKKNQLDHDYIKECFIDCIDESQIETELDRPDLEDYKPGEIPLYGINGEEFQVTSYIQLYLNFTSLNDRNDFNEFKQYCQTVSNVLANVEHSMEKVRLKYPNIRMIFDNCEVDDESIILYI